jgi:hypothetical protein
VSLDADSVTTNACVFLIDAALDRGWKRVEALFSRPGLEPEPTAEKPDL